MNTARARTPICKPFMHPGMGRGVLWLLVVGGILLARPVSAAEAAAEAVAAVAAAMPAEAAAAATPAVAFSATELPPPAPLSASELGALQLEIFVNGYASGWIMPVQQADGALRMQADDLQQVGILPDLQVVQDDGWVNLVHLPGVAAHYDVARQTLDISAADAVRVVQAIDARYRGRATGRDIDAMLAGGQDTGAYLNHSLSLDGGGQGNSGWRRFQSAAGLLDAHVYSPLGVFSSMHLVRKERMRPGWRHTRLETAWSYFDQERLMTWTAGDLVGSGLAWNRPVRMAGVQVRRNFAIRPDLITMPLLDDFTGSAAVPSTVEIYVNNMQQFSQAIAPGPFAISNLPLMTGGGTARMVVRDALGRETWSETPFYAASDMLAKGFVDFSLEAGVARHGYGGDGQEYGHDLIAAGTLRYGASNALTLEGHAETAPHFYQAGIGSALRLGSFGVMTLSAAGSQFRPPVAGGAGAPQHRHHGQQYALGLQAQWRGFNLYANTQHTRGEFNDLASVSLPRRERASIDQWRNLRPPRRMGQLSLSLPQMGGASLTFAYTPMRFHNGLETRLASANASLRLGRRSALSLMVMKDLQRAHSFSAFVGISVFFDNQINTFSTLDYNNQHTTSSVSVSKSTQDQFGDTGWRVRGARGQYELIGAEASYRSRAGLVDVGIERYGGAGGASSNARVQLDGALVIGGGGVFFANRIDNAFAIIRTGAPGIPVQFENRPIGLTNARGQLLLTGLNAFEQNLISIDPMALPVDARADWKRIMVSPNWRSGALVDFKIELAPRTALVNLVDERGKPIPVGARARLNGGGEVLVVGHDGQVYLEGIGEDNRVEVTPPGMPACEYRFTVPGQHSGRLVIHDAICRPDP